MSRSKKAEYTGAKQVSKSCRNHGSCPYCADGRQHCSRRQEPVEQLEFDWDREDEK